MNGDPWAAGPLRGETMLQWLERCVVETWRGADEEPRTIPADVDQVKCVCGRFFTFQPGAQKARCPGCGCRYQKAPR